MNPNRPCEPSRGLRRRAWRAFQLAATGGFLLQFVGCLSGIVPTTASLAESSFLAFLLTQLLF